MSDWGKSLFDKYSFYFIFVFLYFSYVMSRARKYTQRNENLD